ncbi:MAG: hypothetical protein ABEI58_04150 [Candidatus Nanohaloarchaea archaeon]
MLPEKNLRETRYLKKKEKFFTVTGGGTLFLFSLLLAGPILHELMHAAWLEMLGCFYSVEAGFTLTTGVYASIQPVCSMSTVELLAFYSLGYATTIAAGGVLNLLGTRSDSRKKSLVLTAAGTGLLLSILLSVTVEGDIQSIVDLLGLPPFFADFATLFVVLGVFLSSLKPLERLFDDLEREDG